MNTRFTQKWESRECDEILYVKGIGESIPNESVDQSQAFQKKSDEKLFL